MPPNRKIVILAGDGVGPEVTAQAVRVLKAISDARLPKDQPFAFEEHLIGGAAIDAHGSPLPDSTLQACKSSGAILLGAVGGPQWPKPLPSDPSKLGPRPEQGILGLRQSLGLYANLRPVSIPSESILDASPLKPSVASGTDFVMVRELTGGVYFGKRQEEDAQGQAYDTMAYSVDEVKRVARLAGQLAMKSSPPKPVHSIDKANVLATSRMWRRVVQEIFDTEFPSVPLDHHLVDSASMLLVRSPTSLNGVILTENLFGDILSDEASVIPGSLGLLPSASLSSPIDSSPSSSPSSPALYEPIHGSAPDIAGQGIANPIGTILSAALLLRYSYGMELEARAIESAVQTALQGSSLLSLSGVRSKDMGGDATTIQVGDAILSALSSHLSALATAESRHLLLTPPPGRRPMNLCEKIIAHASIGLSAPGDVRPGEMVCVKVDWTLASELTWKGMEKTYGAMGRPGIQRNDRFWLAVDHTVDPRINDQPKPKALISASSSFAQEAKIVDYYGPNQTILHTEFYRQRAQPGMVIIGADSHSCSAGGLGAFAVGLGAADVVMPLVTGETWFRVPETVEIRFTGQPPFGIGGKDTILYVLGQLKRNTVAFERAVEYTGPGLKYLSPDARFAISNMTTEFGGIAGVFEGDEQTAAYLAKRKDPKHRSSPRYFRADPGAEYAESHVIDLSKVESLVALYPSPDNVVPISQCAGTLLDGVFIGACTTAEEDLILAGLVLEAGLAKGWVPKTERVSPSDPTTLLPLKRRVTPGSVQIVAKLRRLGLIEVYERAGFEIGAPGCSYCIAVAADHAGEGEVWLSSQNRNFKNRMGKGSIGNLASAATVAASSFDMAIRDPRDLLDSLDRTKYHTMLEQWLDHGEPIIVSEPDPVLGGSPASTSQEGKEEDSTSIPPPPEKYARVIQGKAQVFGDHVDTDAIIPAQFMPGTSNEDLGTHAFQYFRPEFRDRVKQGATIVVGGIGFGSGSSREEAPRALTGAGVECVIAKSFAFIYARNQPMMSLLGITLTDDRFYELAQEGAEIQVDVAARTVRISGESFPFSLSLMEERLLAGGGVTEMYNKYGSKLFRVAMQQESSSASADGCGGGNDTGDASCGTAEEAQVLAW